MRDRSCTTSSTGSPSRTITDSYAHRSTPAFETTVTDQPVCTALFDGDDRLLAHAIKALDHYAISEGFRYNGWFGLRSKDVNKFLQDNPTPDFR